MIPDVDRLGLQGGDSSWKEQVSLGHVPTSPARHETMQVVHIQSDASTTSYAKALGGDDDRARVLWPLAIA